MNAHVGPVCWRRWGIVLIGAVLLGGVSSAEARLRRPVAMAAAAGRGAEFDPLAAGDTLRAGERLFLRQAIDASRQEQRLAQLGVGQATTADLRSLAQQLTTDCRQITETLEGVARKKGVVLVTSPDDEGSETYTRLSELTGAAFDREFVKTVFAMTDELLKMFERVLADAQDIELRDAAGTHLPALRGHANRVRELRRALE